MDSTYKLLNFGDDYRNYIDSGPGSDFSDFASRLVAGNQSNGKQRTCKRRMRRSVCIKIIISQITVTIYYFQQPFKCNNISYFVILSFDPVMLEVEGQSKMIACRRPKWMMFGKLYWNLDPN